MAPLTFSSGWITCGPLSSQPHTHPEPQIFLSGAMQTWMRTVASTSSLCRQTQPSISLPRSAESRHKLRNISPAPIDTRAGLHPGNPTFAAAQALRFAYHRKRLSANQFVLCAFAPPGSSSSFCSSVPCRAGRNTRSVWSPMLSPGTPVTSRAVETSIGRSRPGSVRRVSNLILGLSTPVSTRPRSRRTPRPGPCGAPLSKRQPSPASPVSSASKAVAPSSGNLPLHEPRQNARSSRTGLSLTRVRCASS